jgi:hypothetical protein
MGKPYPVEDAPFLPMELVNKTMRDYPDAIPIEDARRVNRHFRARFGTPTSALLFLESATTTGWTIQGILEHLDAIKEFPDAGFLMDQSVVSAAVDRAVANNDHLLPLVLRSLYRFDSAAPNLEFVRLPEKNCTCMAVQPVYDTLPEIMYIRFQSNGPAKIACRLNDTKMNSMQESKLAELCAYANYATAQEKFDKGWAADATPEQQAALVANLQTDACWFCTPRSKCSAWCETLLLRALQLEKGEVPYNVQVHIRDLCV